MYTANIRGLGAPVVGDSVLQDAITKILNRVRMQEYPTGTWTISQDAFNKLVVLILQEANAANTPGAGDFQIAEVQAALIARGYKPGSPTFLKAKIPTKQTEQPPLIDDANLFVEPPAALYDPGSFSRPVPPSPTLPLAPTPLPTKKDNTFLWIAGILTLYFLTRKGIPHRSTRSKGKGSVSGDLSGATANCAIWQEVEGKSGGLVWRCLGYGTTCKGKSCQKQAFKFQTRSCIKTKKVATKSPRFNLKTVERCAKYQRVCPDGSCVPETMPKPDPSPGHGVNVRRMARDLARQMAEDRNVDEETVGKAFGREIAESGGLRPYRKTGVERGYSKTKTRLWEEFNEVVPLFMRKKDGLALDEMASEMGFEDDTALLEAIKAEYPKEKGKKKRSWTAADFIAEAEEQVWNALDAGMVSGLGQDLFTMPRGEIVLKVQDTATSDDPLDIFLQRKGWDISRVRELQASIAEKAVPDMFAQRVGKLTAGEVELQRHIQEFLDKVKIPAVKSRKPKVKYYPEQRSLFSEPEQTALFGQNLWM